jgi:hypothetical protein
MRTSRTPLSETSLTPAQRKHIADAEAELAHHLARVKVDLASAMDELGGDVVSEVQTGPREFVVEVEFDASDALHVLKTLPDAAGTAAFVTAQRARRRGWGHRILHFLGFR